MNAILGYIVALTLSMLSLAGFVTWARMGVANVQTAAAASQVLTFDKAAQQYVQDQGATIAATASPSTPFSITGAALIAAGYLPAGFSPTNVFGQAWLLQVLQPNPGVLESLVTSTGTSTITNPLQLVQIAAQAGAQGGFVPYPGQNGDSTMNASTAYGAFGAWSVPLTNYANPGSGHLASLLAFTNTQTNNSYLYRVQVPGHPELNSMQTDLGLTGNKVSDVGQLNFGDSTGTSNATITATSGGNVSLLGPDGTTPANLAQVQNITSSGTLQLGNSVSAGTTCTTKGAIAAASDGSGLIFSCQEGSSSSSGTLVNGTFWVPLGGRWLRVGYYTPSNGATVPVPSCPGGGTPKITISPMTFSVDATGALNFAASGPSAPGTPDVNGDWTISVTDGTGNPATGSVEATTYCAY